MTWLCVSLASYVMDKADETRMDVLYVGLCRDGMDVRGAVGDLCQLALTRVYSNHHPTGILGFCWIPFERELPAERRASYRVLAGIPRAVHHEHVRSGWLVARRGD